MRNAQCILIRSPNDFKNTQFKFDSFHMYVRDVSCRSHINRMQNIGYIRMRIFVVRDVRDRTRVGDRARVNRASNLDSNERARCQHCNFAKCEQPSEENRDTHTTEMEKQNERLPADTISQSHSFRMLEPTEQTQKMPNRFSHQHTSAHARSLASLCTQTHAAFGSRARYTHTRSHTHTHEKRIALNISHRITPNLLCALRLEEKNEKPKRTKRNEQAHKRTIRTLYHT